MSPKHWEAKHYAAMFLLWPLVLIVVVGKAVWRLAGLVEDAMGGE